MMRSTTNDPTFLFDDPPLHWQMTRWEKYGFASILEAARPKVAIEIGTNKGGSLQVIAKHAEKVYSIDLDASLKDRLGSQLPSVEFLAGDSCQVLPPLLDRITKQGEELGFVLIDGDHFTEGMRCDVNMILQYVPVRPLFLVFHDSFHPPCREGILTADWSTCDHVHYVEVDFVPGVYHFEAFDTAPPRSMFGGLAVAVMRPERRAGHLTIHQSQKGLFETILPSSCHVSRKSPLLVRAVQKAKRVTLQSHAASFPSGAIHRRSASQSHCGKKWPIASDDAGTALPFDPVSGRVSGQRAWSACRLGRSPISETSVGGRFAAITPVGVRFLRTRFIGAGAFFCARWGARGAECLPRDIRRRSSQATSRFDGITVHRGLCVRTGSGIMEACPRPRELSAPRTTRAKSASRVYSVLQSKWPLRVPSAL